MQKISEKLSEADVNGHEAHKFLIVDAHRGDGKRFVVRADEKLTAFVKLQAAIRGRQIPRQALATEFVEPTNYKSVVIESAFSA